MIEAKDLQITVTRESETKWKSGLAERKMDNKEIVKYFYEVIVSENLLQEISRYISENCVLNVGDKTVPLGLNGMKQHLMAVKKTYPDDTMKIVRQFADGHFVVSEFIMEGTHEGEWIGIKPTHKRVTVTGVNIDKVVK